MSPLTITCPFALSFAISHTPSCLFFDINLSTSSISAPRTAIIPPWPRGTASCIAFPLSWSKFRASLKFKDSEHNKALYSPRECPAKYLKSSNLKLNSFFKTLKIEKLTVSIAGCVFLVNFNSLSGPSKIIFEISNLSISLASSNIFLTELKFL